MRQRSVVSVAAAVTLLTFGLAPLSATAAPEGAEPLPPADRIELYAVSGPPGTGSLLAEEGFDVTARTPRGDQEVVDVALTPREARKLRGEGFDPEPVRNDKGQTQLQAAAAQAENGFEVWRSYSEPGGIADQVREVAREHPGITKLMTIGHTIQGKPILAIKVTRNAGRVPDGRRTAVLYSAVQHAREWIAAEVNLRMLKYVTGNYESDRRIRRILSSTELWFIPIANPDGYDFTFTEGNRLWRKNLRDNNGDGEITTGDGIDLNRNFPTNWGYDNEGSSSNPASTTYRGTAPRSEPETRAMDDLHRRIGFEFQVNYHSYGPLLLYPNGWQIQTKTADNPIYEAMSGDDAEPAIEGFDPDLSAELYTTNGETTDHAHSAYGTLAWTPELEPGCPGCGFVFPDDEELVQAQFEKNIPFAIDVADSARNPTEPVTHLGNTTPDFEVDSFPVGYGRTQQVQVNAKRSLGPVIMTYSINGGRSRLDPTREWQGGERYGEGFDRWYHRMRATVRGAEPGDEVTVRFWAPSAGKTSESFTYRVADDIGGDVLVLAAEDVTGTDPAQEGDSAKYADDYVKTLAEAGYEADVYDVDVAGRTAPHPLGVLSHYDAVVWETGDDRVPQVEGQPDDAVAKLAVDTELAVRDYLNEGGRLLLTGKYAGYAQGADGDFYYNPFVPDQSECQQSNYPCIPVFNDFLQYYLGAYTYFGGAGSGPDGPFPVQGESGAFEGFSSTLNGGDSADNQDHSASLVITSSVLSPDEFPQFESVKALSWDGPGAEVLGPFNGDWYLYSEQANMAYKRLTRTVDLTGAESGSLEFHTVFETERTWDFVFVEAHTVGQDDWTTLPDANGNTSRSMGNSCPSGWIEQLHPHLAHYQTYVPRDGDQDPRCEPTGTTGEWHAASGDTSGWTEWDIDLSRYAGQQVEVSITYATDWATQDLGVFLDDAAVTVDGSTVADTSFEEDLGGWTVSGAPEGSEPNLNDWTRTEALFEEGAGVTTDDTVYVAFGVEGLTTQAARTDFVRRAMEHLLG